MGAFNELIISATPPKVIQFKYGIRWQYQYRVGERVRWEGVARPTAASGLVVIPGIDQPEPGNGFRYYAISLEDDVIKSVQEISEAEYEILTKTSDGRV